MPSTSHSSLAPITKNNGNKNVRVLRTFISVRGMSVRISALIGYRLSNVCSKNVISF